METVNQYKYIKHLISDLIYILKPGLFPIYDDKKDRFIFENRPDIKEILIEIIIEEEFLAYKILKIKQQNYFLIDNKTIHKDKHYRKEIINIIRNILGRDAISNFYCKVKVNGDFEISSY